MNTNRIEYYVVYQDGGAVRYSTWEQCLSELLYHKNNHSIKALSITREITTISTSAVDIPPDLR